MRDEGESEHSFRVLLVEDEPVAARLLRAQLETLGGRVAAAGSVAQALRQLADASFDLVILDLGLPDGSGLDVLPATGSRGLPVIVQTASDRVDHAVAAMRAGAADFIVKPVTPPRLARAVETALRACATTPSFDPNRPDTPMGRTLRLADKVAATSLPLLIRGETGTGKEWLARRIVDAGPRANRPFLAVNCAALPLDLAESLLFGHERGAFSGAGERHPGRFGEADGGTLLLDEIGELTPVLQAKLLRVLEDGEIDPVGARRPRRVDVRVIAATNRDLAAMMAEGTFRDDLYWRLAVFEIALPPLRERRDEIAALAERFAREMPGRDLRITERAVRALAQRDWPGNIRELRHAVQRAAVLTEGDRLDADAFEEDRSAPSRPTTGDGSGRATEPFPVDDRVPASLADIEREAIARTLRFHRGSLSAAARSLRIGRSTLYRKIQLYGLDDRDA